MRPTFGTNIVHHRIRKDKSIISIPYALQVTNELFASRVLIRKVRKSLRDIINLNRSHLFFVIRFLQESHRSDTGRTGLGAGATTDFPSIVIPLCELPIQFWLN
jgi:hypothetical protein